MECFEDGDTSLNLVASIENRKVEFRALCEQNNRIQKPTELKSRLFYICCTKIGPFDYFLGFAI